MAKKKALSSEKKSVTIFLSCEDFDRLNEICKARKQTRSDYLRAAMTVPDAIPNFDTRQLRGACLEKHLAKLAKEKRAERRARKGTANAEGD